jgi:hypothetical protein
MSVNYLLRIVILIVVAGIIPACFTEDQEHPRMDVFRRAAGTVTDAGTDLPLSGVTYFWSDSLPPFQTRVTDSTGAYSVRVGHVPTGLPADGCLTFLRIGYDTVITQAATLFPDLDTERCTYDVKMVRRR